MITVRKVKNLIYGRPHFTAQISNYWGMHIMRKFITELKGKTVMTNDGQILGMIDNFVLENTTGNINHVLVVPAEEIDARLFRSDAQGRIILPFSEMRDVRDVVVMNVSRA